MVLPVDSTRAWPRSTSPLTRACRCGCPGPRPRARRPAAAGVRGDARRACCRRGFGRRAHDRRRPRHRRQAIRRGSDRRGGRPGRPGAGGRAAGEGHGRAPARSRCPRGPERPVPIDSRACHTAGPSACAHLGHRGTFGVRLEMAKEAPITLAGRYALHATIGSGAWQACPPRASDGLWASPRRGDQAAAPRTSRASRLRRRCSSTRRGSRRAPPPERRGTLESGRRDGGSSWSWTTSRGSRSRALVRAALPSRTGCPRADRSRILAGALRGLHAAHEATDERGNPSASCTATSPRRTSWSAPTAAPASSTSASPRPPGGCSTTRAGR